MCESPNSELLPAAERERAHRHRDRHVDADHADLDVELELAGGAAVAGEDRGAVAELVRVDEATASSYVATRTTESTGPKISSS
jgi:hypothetical protein